MQITPDELEQITKPPVLAVLSTVNPDGSPHATPIWYYYDGESFNVTCHGGRVKVRNIRRNPGVVLTIVDTVGYGTPLMVRGTAELVEEGAAEATVRMATRYEGEERGKKSAEGLLAHARKIGQPRVIVRITPSSIRYGE